MKVKENFENDQKWQLKVVYFEYYQYLLLLFLRHFANDASQFHTLGMSTLIVASLLIH